MTCEAYFYNLQPILGELFNYQNMNVFNKADKNVDDWHAPYDFKNCKLTLELRMSHFCDVRGHPLSAAVAILRQGN